MKNLFYAFLLLLISVSAFTQENFLKGEVLVMLDKQTKTKEFFTEINKETSFQFQVIEKISQNLNIYRVAFDNTYSNSEALNYLNQSGAVLNVQNNHTNVQLRDTCINDSLFASNQWGLENTGQVGGVVDADIDACAAWTFYEADDQPDTSILGDEIVVAVIDAGFDLSHQEINFYTNPLEIPGDSIDNDGNGFIDDVNGWNFYNGSGTITPVAHGMHVSGIVGAKANNSIGVSGVAPGVRVLPIQGSSTMESIVIQSYDYALSMRKRYDSTNGVEGAYVVVTNSSFGIDFAFETDVPLWCAFYDSLGKVGILSVGATANANRDVDQLGDIPSQCSSDYLIMATITNSSDTKHTGAAFGDTTIDIGAPGVSILSTGTSNGFYTSTGTSMSTPFVSGAIAFMYAAACENFMNDYKLNPDSMSLVIKDFILSYGDPNTALQGITTSEARLNLYESINALTNSSYCLSSSIAEEVNFSSKGVKLYPNPNQGSFIVEMLHQDNLEKQLFIYNSIGELIYQRLTNDQTFVVDLDNKPSGVYFLSIQSEKENRYSTTFIVE